MFFDGVTFLEGVGRGKRRVHVVIEAICVVLQGVDALSEIFEFANGLTDAGVMEVGDQARKSRRGSGFCEGLPNTCNCEFSVVIC